MTKICKCISKEERYEHKDECKKEAINNFCANCFSWLPPEERTALVNDIYFCSQQCADGFVKLWKNFYYEIGRLPKAVNS